MIASKHRYSYGQHISKARNKMQRVTNQFLKEQNLSYHDRVGLQTVLIDYKNSNSLRGVSSITKDQNYQNYPPSKKSQNKYHYSINFENSFDVQPLNQNHKEHVDTAHYFTGSKNHSHHTSLLNQSYEKRPYSSKKETVPKYNYPATNLQIDNKQRHQPAKSSKKSQIDFKQDSQISKSCNKFSSNNQKIDIKNYLKEYKSKYQSTQKLQTRKSLPSSYISNRPQNTKLFFDQNKLENNFIATEKFIQFKTQQKPTGNQEYKTKSKYQSHYTKMRNNKKYQAISQEQENIAPQNKQNYNQNSKQSDKQLQVDFQQLLKNSHAENTKIHEKISRISKLNEQINLRLNKMLKSDKAF